MRQTSGSRLPSNHVVFGIAVVVVLASTLVAATDIGGSISIGFVLVLLFAIVAGGASVLGIIARRDSGELAEVPQLITTSQQAAVLERWISRARWGRAVGGFAGVTAAFIATDGGGFSELLVLGAGGIAAGTIAVESHHLRRRRRGVATATLDVRSVRSYLDRGDAVLMAASALVLAGTALTLLVIAPGRTMWWVAIGAVALAIVLAGQQLVARRARPAVSTELRRADDLARALAISHGLARPGVVIVLACCAQGLIGVESHGVAGTVGLVLLCAALGMWWSNRRLGLADAALLTPLGVR